LTGEPREAQSLFTHAFEIADSSLLLPKRQYAVSTFDILLSSKDSSSLNLTDPIFALRQLGSLTTDGTPFKHLSSLFSERVASYQDASSQLEIVCEIVEQEYEISESIESLARFAHAKADLARNQLASHNYAEAVASAETSLDLSSEDFLNPEQRTKSRLSAHLTAGLASYFLGKMDKAIIMFKAALDESGGAADVVCLLSQVLWAKDGAKERHVAQEQLMDCVQAHPGHVQSTILLGVISLLEDDNDSIEAAAEDLQSLRASDQLTVVEQQNVSTILTAIASMSGTSETSKAEKTAEISTSILLSPSQPYGWTALAEQGTESYPADMALKTSQRSVILGKNIDAEDLAGAFADSRTSGNVQRAIAVAPWSSKGWMVLYEVISI
jgi:superkiller protein 3